MCINNNIHKLKERLCKRLRSGEIREIANDAHADTDGTFREDIFALSKDGDERVAYNALWCLTYMPARHSQWFRAKHPEMIDHLLTCQNTSHRRLLLTLLERTFDPKAPLRTDFLDYCLDTINSTLPYTQRALCMKLAYAQCRTIPELLSELREVLELTEYGPTSPGIISARRNIMRQMSRHDTEYTIDH